MGKIIIVVLVVGVIGGYFLMRDTSKAPVMTPAGDAMKQAKEMPKGESPTGPLKEFTMTAYYDAQGKWFSLKEMTVKKGDHVRVRVTNTAGMHDWMLDEFGIKQELPLNQEVVIDFAADKVGTFEYYCSKPGHRAGGQVGKIIVTE